ncbi:hypothetical protein [Streptomyces sp. CBMA29]|uniref:hypothetical protein n=1 Tax=Streptomyces sp. CBMA29 TaxID=1896314 RepID=UPI001661A713|nr:hypothetical protein [Streptomyces sp. CBMA29]MBD0739822.1 hypothetical protein [Streptomyces sp. CBMA29]
MSLTQRFMMESEDIQDRASVIGWIDDDTERFKAVQELFAECGEMAQAYADPLAVARLFVGKVTDAFYAARAVARACRSEAVG